MALNIPKQGDRCKSCGAVICWVKMSKSQKWMPVDPDKLTIVVIPQNSDLGEVQYGYQSHFSTCPNADKHRRVKRK